MNKQQVKEKIYSAYQKKVIHFQRPIVLKSIDLNPLSIGTLLVSCMSRIIEYIAIEDDSVIVHFLQVLRFG